MGTTSAASLKVWAERRAAGTAYRGDFGDRLAQHCHPDRNSGCWLFCGSPASSGYARTDIGGRRVLAHRASWEWHNRASIPAGMFVCHRCDTPACVNPDHLFLGTPRDNVEDMDRKGRRRCVSPIGTNNAGSKLNEGAVREILADYAAGVSSTVIAERFSVDKNTIASVLRGDTWKHVPGDRPRLGATAASGRNRRTGYKRRSKK